MKLLFSLTLFSVKIFSGLAGNGDTSFLITVSHSQQLEHEGKPHTKNLIVSSTL